MLTQDTRDRQYKLREIARQIESELEKRGIELSLQKEGDLTREVLDSFTQNELRFAVLRTTAKRCRRDRITVEEAQEIVQNEDLVESPTESNSEAERLKPAKSSITKSWARKHQIDSCQEVERPVSQPAVDTSADKQSVSEYTYTDAESSDPDSQAATSSAAVAKPSSAASSKAVAKPSSVTERSSAVQAEAAASSALPDVGALPRTEASSAVQVEAEPDAEPEDFQEESSSSLSPSEETGPPAAIHEEPLHEEPAAGWVDQRCRNRLGEIICSRGTQTVRNSPSSPTDTGAGTSGGESPSSGYFRRREVKRLRGLRLELEKNIDAEIEDLEAQEKASQAKKSSSSAIPAEASSATQAEAESSSATQAEAKSKVVEREV